MNNVHIQVNQVPASPVIGLCLLAVFLGVPVFAQQFTVPSENLAEKRESLALELEGLRRALETADRFSEQQADSMSREIEILERTDLVYAQLDSQQQRIEELELAKSRLQEELDRMRQSGPSEPETGSFPSWNLFLLTC